MPIIDFESIPELGDYEFDYYTEQDVANLKASIQKLLKELAYNQSGVREWEPAYNCRIRGKNSRHKCRNLNHGKTKRKFIRLWYGKYKGEVDTIQKQLDAKKKELAAAESALTSEAKRIQEEGEARTSIGQAEQQEAIATGEKAKNIFLYVGIVAVAIIVIVILIKTLKT